MVFRQDNKSDCRCPDIRAAAIAQVSGTPHGVSRYLYAGYMQAYRRCGHRVTPRDTAGRSPDPHTEALPASGTADGMLACLARQTQYRAAGGAGTEHVRFRVCRTRRAFTVTEGGLHLAQETEPCGVLALAGGDVPRQEAADRPDHCSDRQHVQYRARNAEAGQGRWNSITAASRR